MSRILPSVEIWNRADLPYLAMWRKLFRVVEVGVDRGEFASVFLSRWIGHEYWGVDDYAPYPERPYDRQADFLFAVDRLRPYSDRVRLVRMGSVEAAGIFADGSVDLVYIDAAHDYESVAADLAAWWPKVSDRGILAGHDFDATHPGVVEAVTQFGAMVERDVYLTAVEGYNREDCPSYYLYKSGMPGPDWRRC